MPSTLRIAGIDGCRVGWIAATATLKSGELSALRCTLIETLGDLLHIAKPPELIAVDIPIGLPDAAEPGGRLADSAAREALPGKSSSVFSPPVRAVLEADSYPRANIVMRRSSEHELGLSKQAWNIVPKVREADKLVRSLQRVRNAPRFLECHPELTFATLAMGPIASSKRTADGQRERIAVLREQGIDLTESIMDSASSPGVNRDDIIDAHACLLTAMRFALKAARPFPDEKKAPVDSQGIEMRIWA